MEEQAEKKQDQPAPKRRAVELFAEDTPVEFRVQWQPGIFVFLHASAADTYRRLRRKYAKRMAGAKSTEAEKMDAGEAFVREHAAHSLIRVEGYVFTTRSKEIAGAMAEALGSAVVPAEEVDLDGKWTDAVKAVVFHYAPKFAKWCSDEADKIAKQEDEEEQATSGN